MRHFPIESIHPLAFKAAEAVKCATKQGKGQAMHQRLFERQDALDEVSLLAHAKLVAAEPRAFSDRRHTGATAQAVRRDLKTASVSASVRHQHSFLVQSMGPGNYILCERSKEPLAYEVLVKALGEVELGTIRRFGDCSVSTKMCIENEGSTLNRFLGDIL